MLAGGTLGGRSGPSCVIDGRKRGCEATCRAWNRVGLGTQDPGKPEWGRMLADSQNLLASTPRLALIPGAAIVVAALGFNLVGDALREALDPKLRR